jgi:uncharacterized membrane protein YsdA (DUF1294 family)
MEIVKARFVRNPRPFDTEYSCNNGRVSKGITVTVLSVALVLIFVLYLIDKHSLWRKVAKIAIYTVTVFLVVGAGIYGWLRYDAYRSAKRQEAEDAAYRAKMKPTWDCGLGTFSFQMPQKNAKKTQASFFDPSPLRQLLSGQNCLVMLRLFLTPLFYLDATLQH